MPNKEPPNVNEAELRNLLQRAFVAGREALPKDFLDRLRMPRSEFDAAGWVLPRSGIVAEYIEARPDIAFLADEHGDHFYGLQQVRDLERFLLDEVWKSPHYNNDPKDHMIMVHQYYMEPLIKIGVSKVAEGGKPQDVANELASRIVAGITQPTEKYKLLALLLNFRCHAHGPIVLSPTLRLRRLTDDEMGSLFLTMTFGRDSSEWMHIPQISWAAEAEIEFPRTAEKPWLVAEQLIKDVTTVLRLLKAGNLQTRHIATKALQIGGQLPGGLHDFERLHTSPPVLELRPEDIPSLKQIWADFEKVARRRQPRPLEILLRRFHDAYGREQLVDQLTDLVIALEGLLLKGTKQELRYRFAYRGAAIAEPDAAKRPTAAKALMEAYDGRSEIVHGDKEDVSEAEVLALEEYVRRALREAISVLATNKSHDALLKSLDTCLLSNEKSYREYLS